MFRWNLALLVAAAMSHVAAQTTAIDLSRQGKLGTGTTLPAQCVTGQMFFKTDAPAGANLYACQSNAWTVVGSGNGGLCTVALSATPVFDASQCGAFALRLGGTAVTGSSLVNAKAGQWLTFIVSQDSTGGRPFTWPGNVTRPCAVSGTPGVSSIVTALYDGVNAETTSCTTTELATLVMGPTRSAPGAPSSGLSCWFDSSGTWKCKDMAGKVHAAVLTALGSTLHEYMTYIDSDGVPHTAPISANDLSNGTTGSGAVVLASNPTLDTPSIANLLNAQHTHTDAASGGQLTEPALNLADVTTNDASTSRHGFLPKLPGDSSKCLLGDGTYGGCGTGGGGSGIVTMSTGAGAPTGNCAAPGAYNLAMYFDTSNRQLWYCNATNTWRNVLDTSGSGGYMVTGAVGSAPAAPASGSVTCYFDATAKTQICLDSAGNAFTSVKTASGGTSHQWVDYIAASGIPHTSQPGFGDLTGSVTASQMPALTGDCVTSAGAVSTTCAAKMKTRVCEIHIWGSGSGQTLQDTDDELASCYNGYGVTETITAVSCWANGGAPTVTPVITGGGATSILTGALTCGTGAIAAGTLNGSPTLASGGTIDVNITSAGGTATNIRMFIVLTR